MKAMLLAAGFGTRLRPLTHRIPKPLIPINGLPLIFYNLALLKKNGIRHVVINLHHLGNQIRKVLGNGKKFGLKIRYSMEPAIMGTGGGIQHAKKFLKGRSPFFVLNGDIIIDLDLKKMVRRHRQKRPLATLAVRKKPTTLRFGPLYVNRKGEIVSILSPPPQQKGTTPTLFTGVHLLDERVFRWQKVKGKWCIIREGYIPRLAEGKKIHAFFQKGYWNDLGTLSRLKQTEKGLKTGRIRLSYAKYLREFGKILDQQALKEHF